jgi:hypothetical protein
MPATVDGYTLPEATHCRDCQTSPATLAFVDPRPDQDNIHWARYLCHACATKTKNAELWKRRTYALPRLPGRERDPDL